MRNVGYMRRPPSFISKYTWSAKFNCQPFRGYCQPYEGILSTLRRGIINLCCVVCTQQMHLNSGMVLTTNGLLISFPLVGAKNTPHFGNQNGQDWGTIFLFLVTSLTRYLSQPPPVRCKVSRFPYFCAKKPRYGYGVGMGSPAPFIIIFYSLRRTENTRRVLTTH